MHLDIVCWCGENLRQSLSQRLYKELVEKQLKSLQDIGANMSIKVLFFFLAIEINFRWIAPMSVMSKENDSIRISKQ